MDMSGGAAVLEAFDAIAELGLELDLRRGDPGDREHAERDRDQARRHHHPAQRQDGRGQQHRRRGAADPRRCAHLLRPRAGRRAAGRPRDAHRRGAGRARLDLRGADLQRRRAGPPRSSARPIESGELAWRLPLHPEYKELTKGTVADLTNAAAKRKAGRSTPARSSRSSSTTSPGPTSTSPAPPGTPAASTSARARPASAFGCWSRSRDSLGRRVSR